MVVNLLKSCATVFVGSFWLYPPPPVTDEALAWNSQHPRDEKKTFWCWLESGREGGRSKVVFFLSPFLLLEYPLQNQFPFLKSMSLLLRTFILSFISWNPHDPCSFIGKGLVLKGWRPKNRGQTGGQAEPLKSWEAFLHHQRGRGRCQMSTSPSQAGEDVKKRCTPPVN